AKTVSLGERPPTDTCRAGKVVIVARRQTALGQRGGHREFERCALEPAAAEGDRASTSVQPIAAIVEVVLDRKKRLQHLRPAPADTAELIDPAVVVVGQTP